MRPFWLHTEARLEFTKARDFLEKRRPGEGERFHRAVRQSLLEIAAAPEIWPKHGKFRKFLVPVYRYRIFYDVSSEGVHVVAIVHPSREPDYWKNLILDDEQR